MEVCWAQGDPNTTPTCCSFCPVPMSTCDPLTLLAALLPLLMHKGHLHVCTGDAANSQVLPRDLSSIMDVTKKETVSWPWNYMAMPEGVAQVSLDQWLCYRLRCSTWGEGIVGFLLASWSVSAGLLPRSLRHPQNWKSHVPSETCIIKQQLTSICLYKRAEDGERGSLRVSWCFTDPDRLFACFVIILHWNWHIDSHSFSRKWPSCCPLIPSGHQLLAIGMTGQVKGQSLNKASGLLNTWSSNENGNLHLILCDMLLLMTLQDLKRLLLFNSCVRFTR